MGAVSTFSRPRAGGPRRRPAAGPAWRARRRRVRRRVASAGERPARARMDQGSARRPGDDRAGLAEIARDRWTGAPLRGVDALRDRLEALGGSHHRRPRRPVHATRATRALARPAAGSRAPRHGSSPASRRIRAAPGHRSSGGGARRYARRARAAPSRRTAARRRAPARRRRTRSRRGRAARRPRRRTEPGRERNGAIRAREPRRQQPVDRGAREFASPRSCARNAIPGASRRASWSVIAASRSSVVCRPAPVSAASCSARRCWSISNQVVPISAPARAPARAPRSAWAPSGPRCTSRATAALPQPGCSASAVARLSRGSACPRDPSGSIARAASPAGSGSACAASRTLVAARSDSICRPYAIAAALTRSSGTTPHAQRRGRDSNPRTSCPVSGFQDRCIRPLCHPSGDRQNVGEGARDGGLPRSGGPGGALG